MEHSLLTHTNCTINNCFICDGGILVCTVCGGGESSLSTDCIGRQLTDQEQTAISNGDDYKDSHWIKPYIHG